MIRAAEEKDIPSILKLLDQVNEIHNNGRPDVFKRGTKYKEKDLKLLFQDKTRPVFVYDEDGVLGYAFCIYEEIKNNQLLCDRKTLYIDDLCVDASCRGKGIGKALYAYVKDYAAEHGFYDVTLHVWGFNESAIRFYEAIGLRPMCITMEEVLKK